MGLAAHSLVPMKFLNPLKVNRRHNADEEIRILRYVNLVGLHSAMQTLVKHYIGVRRKILPRGEHASLQPIGKRFLLVV
jgi:hypothetical protein